MGVQGLRGCPPPPQAFSTRSLGACAVLIEDAVGRGMSGAVRAGPMDAATADWRCA